MMRDISRRNGCTCDNAPGRKLALCRACVAATRFTTAKEVLNYLLPGFGDDVLGSSRTETSKPASRPNGD
jgi:hypothetical protein